VFGFHSQNVSSLACFLLIACRSTEHDHVKDNLPAKLLRIRTFGKMKLEEFKDLISPQDYKTCEAKMLKNPTWYPLTLDIFVKFLYKVILPPHHFALRAHKHVFILAILCLSPLPISHSFSRLFMGFRESSRTLPTLLQGCTGRIHPSPADQLPKFGIL